MHSPVYWVGSDRGMKEFPVSLDAIVLGGEFSPPHSGDVENSGGA